MVMTALELNPQEKIIVSGIDGGMIHTGYLKGVGLK